MRKHHQLQVELTLLGPILTKGGQTAEPGIDAPLARDALGRPMLPFSLIKGKIVDAFRDIPLLDDLRRKWFGVGSGDKQGNYEAERGCVRFSDFHTTQQGKTDQVIERIQIDSDTGSASGRMLAMLEAPFGYGEPVTFKGRIDFIADAGEAVKIHAELDLAFRWVPAFGALRSVGFGRTKEVIILPAAVLKSAVGTPALTAAQQLPVRWKPDRPLCLVGRKHSRNHFESLEAISGSVLKGAVARLVLELNNSARRFIDPNQPENRFPTLCRHFETLRFSEARPQKSDAKTRPVEPPLSVVVSPLPQHEQKYFDVALEEKPRLIEGAAPAFQPDWKKKDTEVVRTAFGWSFLPTERRTRTAIDENLRRAADQQLFSYGLVQPERGRNGISEESFVWESRIGLEEVPAGERAVVQAELSELLACGLPNLGKTRAIAHVEWLAAPTPPHLTAAVIPEGLHVVTLQTECLMTDPQDLQAGSIEQAYAKFWNEASNQSLELVRFFAKQTLHGGYLVRRLKRPHYEPFLLTERGSAFVLKPTGRGDPSACLERWRNRGLSTAKWVQTRYGAEPAPLWKTCPYLPHAGYGEVAIDLECHKRIEHSQEPS